LRQGFLHRFAIVAFIIGIILLPYLDYYVDSPDLSRLGLKGVGLGNPNSLAMWFGFSSVYFFVAGTQSKNNLSRAIWWVLSLGSLYAVAITVSRGPLLAVAIAGVIALRKLMKRGFVPVLFLLIVFWAGLMSGVFDKVVGFYMERGGEDTGRWFLWTSAIEKFFTSPWVGVGTSATGAELARKYVVNPHNGLLYIGVSSGVIPLYFFIAYWLRSGRSALKAKSQGFPDAAFHLPLFVFALLEMLLLDTVFMSAWHMVVLSSLMPARFPRRVRKVITQEPFREGRSIARAPGFGSHPSRPWQTSAKWYSRT
jgi:O-antigen ligase